MALSVGIEACGKSYTVAAVAEKDGTIIAAQRYSARLNYHEMTKSDLAVEMYRIVKSILNTCGQNVTEFTSGKGSICVGVTGITTKYDRDVGMAEVWKAAGLSTGSRIATGGIEIAFTGAAKTLFGAAITCRAGSAALARTDKVIRRVGGWGHLLGDEGSGYWIGLRALQALCKLQDGRVTTSTKLGEYVKQELYQIPAAAEVLSDHDNIEAPWVDALVLLAQRTKHNEFRYIVSDVAKAVFKTWEADPNDLVSRRIVENAASILVEQLCCAMRKARLSPNSIPLVLRGGVFKYNPAFAELLRHKLHKEWPQMRVLLPSNSRTSSPVIGAVLFALSGSVFSLPDAEVIKRVEKHADKLPPLDG